MPRRHSWLLHHPLLRKGGVHKRSRSAERHVLRDALQQELDDYMDDLVQGEEKAASITPASVDAGDD